jgi:hypothetical protein
MGEDAKVAAICPEIPQDEHDDLAWNLQIAQLTRELHDINSAPPKTKPPSRTEGSTSTGKRAGGWRRGGTCSCRNPYGSGAGRRCHETLAIRHIGLKPAVGRSCCFRGHLVETGFRSPPVQSGR